MYPHTQIQNSMDEQQQQHDQDLNQEQHAQELHEQELDHDLDHDLDDGDHRDSSQDGNDNNGYESGAYYCMDNNLPDSYAICDTKVADWLDRNTFIERKASVKFACAKNNGPCQTRTSRRSVSLNQKPKLAIIGFRKKPVHQTDGKSKHNDRVENVRLFRNRSEPGRDYCLVITEPVSPRVSCVGRVGSVRVQGKKAGVWRSFKAAFSNLVQTNRVGKIAV